MDRQHLAYSSMQAAASHNAATTSEARHDAGTEAERFESAYAPEDLALQSAAVAEETARTSSGAAYECKPAIDYNTSSTQNASYSDSTSPRGSSLVDSKLSPSLSSVAENVRRPRTTTLLSSTHPASMEAETNCSQPETPACPETPASPLQSACQLSCPSEHLASLAISHAALSRTVSASTVSQSAPSTPVKLPKAAVLGCAASSSKPLVPLLGGSMRRERKPEHLQLGSSSQAEQRNVASEQTTKRPAGMCCLAVSYILADS